MQQMIRLSQKRNGKYNSTNLIMEELFMFRKDILALLKDPIGIDSNSQIGT